jgi:hypothetical protein
MFFSGFKLQPEKKWLEKKGTVESSDRPFFRRVQITTRKIMTGKKGTLVWPMEAAQIWRERYDRKKMHSCLAGNVFQRVQITTGINYDQKKKRYSHLANLFSGHNFSGRNLIDEETHQKT